MSAKTLFAKIAGPVAIVAGSLLVAAPAASAAATQVDGEGTYLVGVDIAPGTYVSHNGDWCYWARLSGLSGELDDIIANDISESGTMYVTIAPSDRAFESSNCATWTLVQSAAPAPRPSTGSFGF